MTERSQQQPRQQPRQQPPLVPAFAGELAVRAGCQQLVDVGRFPEHYDARSLSDAVPLSLGELDDLPDASGYLTA
ncbi:MAG: hypothetical protein QOG60_931, partial [Frankiaceae bacterium]|nr:hypothetical protein [Frankiaceae bacterium]